MTNLEKIWYNYIVEDLKKLKDELEKQSKYVIVSQITDKDIMNAGEPISSSEILSQEKTDEVVKQCELLIEKAVSSLTMKGIPFDQLTISSNMGFICRPDYIDEWKKYYQENDRTNEKWFAIMKKLDTQILPEIVPVSFSINTAFTGTEDCDIDSYADEAGLSYNDLYVGNVSGVVNWGKFVIQMKALGYNIDFLNYGDGASFSDYIETVKHNGFDTQINVTADLGRTKKSTSRKM